jgi:hypothetical protein
MAVWVLLGFFRRQNRRTKPSRPASPSPFDLVAAPHANGRLTDGGRAGRRRPRPQGSAGVLTALFGFRFPLTFYLSSDTVT